MKKKINEVTVGGGATGVSTSGPGPTGGTATLPASKKQGDSMETLNNPNPCPKEETSTENNTAPTGDMSAKNRASVAMKASAASGSMKEEVTAMFEGTEINADLVQAAAALFEATVEKRVLAIAEDLESQYNEALDEAYTTAIEEVGEAVETFIEMTAEKFITENELAIVSGIRSELAESFMSGLADLLEDHYLDVPDEAVDVVDALTARIDELEEQLDLTLTETATLRKDSEEVVRLDTVKTVAEGLTVTQQEKFMSLAEGIDFTGDVKDYSDRLAVIKETYFPTGKKATTSTVLTEEVAPEATGKEVKNDSSVSRYVSALSRTNLKR